MKSKVVSFFRPIGGGATQSTRELFFLTSSAIRLEKVIDPTCKPHEAFQVLLTLSKKTASVFAPNVQEGVLECTVEGCELVRGSIQLCLQNEQELDKWFTAVYGECHHSHLSCMCRLKTVLTAQACYLKPIRASRTRRSHKMLCANGNSASVSSRK
jgi:hypothetical protein